MQETILNGHMQCSLSIGWEERQENKTLSRYGLQMYKDKAGQLRIFKAGQVGMILQPDGRKRWRIAHVYTCPECRRQGLAKMLLAIVRAVLGHVRHCDNLSEAGKAWALSVG